MDIGSTFGPLPFTRSDAVDLGLTKRQIKAAVAAGHLTVMRRGVYVCQDAPDDRTRHAKSVAVALKGRSNYMACSGSALALLDLPNPYFTSWSQVPVTIAGPKSNPDQGMRRNPGWLPVPTDWGLSTDAVDTAAAIAAELPLPQALMVVDAVARLLAGIRPGETLTNAQRIELASERCRTEVRRRLTHKVNLRALRLANPAAESPAESFYRGHMILHGYQDPACGVPMRGVSGKQYFIDILLPGLAVEVDGEGKYDSRTDLLYEKHREDDLRATGLAFHRAWVKDVYADPETAMAHLKTSYPQGFPHLGITTAV